MDFKDTIKVILTSGHYTLISYIKGDSPEWNVARDYNPEDKSWVAGNYCYSFESALAVFLEKMDSRFVKTDYQIEVEKKYPELSYARMVELSTLFKDGLLADDEETAMEYFDETCEMSEDEKVFFELPEKNVQEETTNEESLQEPVMIPHLRRGR